jgi:GTP-binding protein
MVVGLHLAGDNDLTVNAVRPKQLTNIRAAGSDEAVVLHSPIRMGLERAMEFIEDDEMVEITPQNIRIRKKILQEGLRGRGKPKKNEKD